jgi:DDE superfamily endonuclease
VVNKETKQVICTAFTNGKRHDFRLFKESKTKIHYDTKVITDTGYQGIQKLHSKSELPKKKTKKNPLTKEDKKKNKELATERVASENVIGMIKRFKIISDRYRNRRKRFGLRFNLIAGIYNWELKL